MDHHSTQADRALDIVAVVATVGTLVERLPAIAALFTIIWTGIRIWETDTVQRWFGRSGGRKKDSE